MAGGAYAVNRPANLSGSNGINATGRNIDARALGLVASASPLNNGAIRSEGSASIQAVADQLALQMPAQIGGANWQADPLGYCRNSGLTPVSEVDADAVQTWPDLALHALAQSSSVISRLKHSTGRHASTTQVHVTLGENANPRAKASFHVRVHI